MRNCFLFRVTLASCAYSFLFPGSVVHADSTQNKFELQMHIRPKSTQVTKFVRTNRVVFQESLKTTVTQNDLTAEFTALGITDGQLFLRVKVKKSGARATENFADFEFSLNTKTRNHFLTAETKTGEVLEIQTRPINTNAAKTSAKNIYALRTTFSRL